MVTQEVFQLILKGIGTVEADTVLLGREFQASFDCAGEKKKSFDIERFLVEVPGLGPDK